VGTTFAIGAILILALIKHGYPTAWAAALQGTSAELGVIIPPSIPMILYGVPAEISIGELFIAGFGLGFLIGGALMLYVFLLCRKIGWGKLDGEGKLPALTAAYDLAIIGGGIALLLLGNKKRQSFRGVYGGKNLARSHRDAARSIGRRGVDLPDDDHLRAKNFAVFTGYGLRKIVVSFLLKASFNLGLRL